jgi:hypothetical protein
MALELVDSSVGERRFRFVRFGILLTLAVTLLASCSSSSQIPCECPAPSVSIVVLEPDGGQLSGVAATLSGPTTVTLTSTPATGGIDCESPPGFETAGTYTLMITAPGFQQVDMAATVTVTHGSSSCGCTVATVQPSTVTLEPSG